MNEASHSFTDRVMWLGGAGLGIVTGLRTSELRSDGWAMLSEPKPCQAEARTPRPMPTYSMPMACISSGS